jgi:hypothetical protein
MLLLSIIVDPQSDNQAARMTITESEVRVAV